jgi:nickel-type superoxide dismutase maturation protease
MVPTLRPGDHVIVLRRRVRAGDVAAVRDPREPSRILVKRVEKVDRDGLVTVAGDNPGASTDSRHFGPLAPALVVGRVVYRYAPTDRAGRVGRAG